MIDYSSTKGGSSPTHPQQTVSTLVARPQSQSYSNPSCDLLEIHELLRSNAGWKSIAPGEEEAHGRENYSDLLSV
jgi:hypothetical protein